MRKELVEAIKEEQLNLLSKYAKGLTLKEHDRLRKIEGLIARAEGGEQ